MTSRRHAPPRPLCSIVHPDVRVLHQAARLCPTDKDIQTKLKECQKEVRLKAFAAAIEGEATKPPSETVDPSQIGARWPRSRRLAANACALRCSRGAVLRRPPYAAAGHTRLHRGAARPLQGWQETTQTVCACRLAAPSGVR
jgi:hypothetical protein